MLLDMGSREREDVRATRAWLWLRLVVEGMPWSDAPIEAVRADALVEAARVCSQGSRLVPVVGRLSRALGTALHNGELIAHVAVRAVCLSRPWASDKRCKDDSSALFTCHPAKTPDLDRNAHE